MKCRIAVVGLMLYIFYTPAPLIAGNKHEKKVSPTHHFETLQINLALVPEEKNIAYRDSRNTITYKMVDKLDDHYFVLLQNPQTPKKITLKLGEYQTVTHKNGTIKQSHTCFAINGNTFSKAPFSDEERIYLILHTRVLKKNAITGHYLDIFGNEIIVEGASLPDTLTLVPFNAVFIGDNKRIYQRVAPTHFKGLR